MIRFACPACRKEMTSPADKAGWTVKCLKCGQQLEIPPEPHQTILAVPFPPSEGPRPVWPEQQPTEYLSASILPAQTAKPASATNAAGGADAVPVFCPGCGRGIALPPHELSWTIECAKCGTRFSPNGNTPVLGEHPEPEKANLPPAAPPPFSGNTTDSMIPLAEFAPDGAAQASPGTAYRTVPHVDRVPQADLEAAADELRRCEKEGRNAGHVFIREKQVDHAMRSAQELQREFDEAVASSRPSLRLRYLHMVELFDSTGLPQFGMGWVIVTVHQSAIRRS